MGVVGIIGAIGPVAKLLMKVLEQIDPKTRDWVRKRKALEWGEKFILKYEELSPFLMVKMNLTKKEKRKVAYLKKKLRWYKKCFFLYD